MGKSNRFILLNSSPNCSKLTYITNYDEFLTNNIEERAEIEDYYKNYLLPFWDEEVERVVVEGKRKDFDIYLVSNERQNKAGTAKNSQSLLFIIHLKCNFFFDKCIKFIDRYSYLIHSISVTNCYTAVLNRIKVIGDTVRCSDFVLSAISLTD